MIDQLNYVIDLLISTHIMFSLPIGQFFAIMTEIPMHRTDNEPTPPKSEFVAKLEAQWSQGNFLCVGLDSEYERLPESVKSAVDVGEAMFNFNRAIIDATQGLVASYKPNAAFYEAQGDNGLIALRRTIAYIHKTQPNIPVILDAKRGDIGNTNNGYVASAFDDLKADAITVHPYLGREALQPFLDRKDKGIIVLARTSNPGAGEFQDLVGPNGKPLYLTVAQRVAEEWNTNGNCALVIGATYPRELAEIRAVVGNIPFLIPGIGKQGGKVEEVVPAGMDSRTWGMIINSSRDILFASSGPDFPDASRQKAQEIKEAINLARVA